MVALRGEACGGRNTSKIKPINPSVKAVLKLGVFFFRGASCTAHPYRKAGGEVQLKSLVLKSSGPFWATTVIKWMCEVRRSKLPCQC